MFNKTKHEEGRFPVCEDKNECSEDNGGQYLKGLSYEIDFENVDQN